MKLNRHYAIAISLVVACVIVGIVMMAPQHAAGPASPQATPSPAVAAADYTGQIVCLPHKVKTGPQTTECALGIQTDDGKYYGVRNSPTITGFQIGARVTVTGRLSAAAANETYDVAGNIDATNITVRP